MLGDDVVDLRDPEAAPGATHPRFDERVFAAAERSLLEGGGSPTRLRWTVWAAKESAFKAARKLDSRTRFSPARFVMHVANYGEARVTHAGRSFTVRIAQADDAVHAVALARPAPSADVFAESLRVRQSDPSAAVRRFAIDRLAALLGIDPGRLTIVNRLRIPLLLLDDRPSAVDLSLSHHGGVVGFAALLPRRAQRREEAWPGALEVRP
jgi:phosphopantetheinyl transferase (holo-ACP synthase)